VTQGREQDKAAALEGLTFQKVEAVWICTRVHTYIGQLSYRIISEGLYTGSDSVRFQLLGHYPPRPHSSGRGLDNAFLFFK
jgi:hypothetical protein